MTGLCKQASDLSTEGICACRYWMKQSCANTLVAQTSMHSADMLAFMTMTEPCTCASNVIACVQSRCMLAGLTVIQLCSYARDLTFCRQSGDMRCRYDSDRGIARLAEGWVSLAAAKQRRGRAGRVRPGACFKMFSRRQAGRMQVRLRTCVQRHPKKATTSIIIHAW